MLDADLTNRECPESRRNPPFFLRNRCGDDDKHSEPLEQRQRNEKKEKEAQLVSHATYGLVGFCCCFLYRLSDSDLCTGSLSCLLFYGASSQCCVSSCPLFPSLLGSLFLSLLVSRSIGVSLSLSWFIQSHVLTDNTPTGQASYAVQTNSNWPFTWMERIPSIRTKRTS